jgi:hypothetical protein
MGGPVPGLYFSDNALIGTRASAGDYGSSQRVSAIGPTVTVSLIGGPTYGMGLASTVPKSRLISGQTVSHHRVPETLGSSRMCLVYTARATRLRRMARRAVAP